jgi:hypothetical protein
MNDRSTLSAGTVIPLSQSIFQRFALVWLCLIILLGFGIRLSGLKWGQAYSYFGQGDAVEAYQVAVNYGHGEEKALYLGQPNYNAKSKLPGPMWTLFCFASYRFWGSIEGVIFTIILLNTAVIYLNYLLARRTIGPEAGLWSALFTALSPWVVYYSNGLYNPDVMAFLGAVLFLALWNAVQSERTAWIFWAPIVPRGGACFAVESNSHPCSLVDRGKPRRSLPLHTLCAWRHESRLAEHARDVRRWWRWIYTGKLQSDHRAVKLPGQLGTSVGANIGRIQRTRSRLLRVFRTVFGS